jgi:hypothetical protein
MNPILLSVIFFTFGLTLAAQANPSDSAKIAERYGKLPLTFEANHGQSDSQVKFLPSCCKISTTLVLHPAGVF